MNYGFIIDNRKCIGCHACTVACKQEHDLPIGVNRTWVKYIEKGEFPNTRRMFSVQRCNHCADAPCVEICPVTALWKRKDGIVDFSGDRCIGCKACMQACPYDAIYLHPETQTAAKCNYCAHRVEIGLQPPCVTVCPEHAIIAGDMHDPSTEISGLIGRHQMQVRKPEKGTEPQVFYIDGDAASLNPTYTETKDYIWSEIPQRMYQVAPPRLKEAETEARRVYDQGQSHTDSWGGKVAAYLWTKSISAGIPLVALLQSFRTGKAEMSFTATLTSLIFLIVTSILLVADLKQPMRFHWIILRPQWKSWLTRGAFILMGFGGLLTLSLLQLWQSPLFTAIFYLTALFAFGSAVYSAFLFWQAKGRDLWQSPVFAVHLVVMALLAGAAMMIFIRESVGLARMVMLASVILHGGLILFDLIAVHSTQHAKIAARHLYHNNLLFWIGAILVGVIVPIVTYSFPVISAACALAGLLIYERLWIRAGQSVPLS